ncbi:hypothetical protein Cfor_11465 [Coptotermes formosanus]|uniref:CDC45-like protein n=1 Tax=Coptotermes formosanus TaxID=36987 RepID=A0A6L2PYN9_COPFO|nr:hypothetical protein Cfor_11465 [Coptotermes formosanus]
MYTLVPVQGITDLQKAYEENSEEIKYVVLVNCGGTVDIVDALQPEDDVVFFVIDSHKPTDVCNVYNNGQIRLLSRAEDDEGIPDFEEIFQDESEEEGEGGSDADSAGEGGAEESRQGKRRRLDEEAILKRRERRLWEEKRDRLMFDYTQFSYYGRSSAVIIFELAWKLSKDNTDLLWWAIVGVTEQILMGKVENQQYVLETGNLQGHVARLGYQGEALDDENSIHHKTAIKITYDKDLQLALYRHWTVEASLRHSMYSAVKLKLWTLRGQKKLNELLAEMGLPLVQSRQKFSAMDLVLRQEFHSMIAKLAEKYQLNDIVFASFLLQYGFRSRYCAADIVYAMLASLESMGRDKSPADCFMDALDCLSRYKKCVLEQGIEKAKQMLTCIFKQVQAALDMRQVVSAGPFVYLILQEGTLDAKMFSRPHCITLLAHFALRAYVASSRNRKAPTLPLIASAPHDLDKGTCLVVGIPPTCEDSPKK